MSQCAYTVPTRSERAETRQDGGPTGAASLPREGMVTMTTTTVTPALPEVPAAGTVYAHSTTGWTFTTDGHRGPFGASLSGVWQNGTAGVIFPTETFRDGAPVWSIR